MKCTGDIFLDRELTFTQAQKITKCLIGMQIGEDGKTIQWNGMEILNLEESLSMVMPILKSYKIIAVGIMEVVIQDRSYRIIVIKNKVKVQENSIITTITPNI